MKIAQVVCSFPPYKSGIGNSVYQFAKVMAKSEYDVTVFAPDYSDVLQQEEIKDGFKIIRLKSILKYGNAAFLPQLLWRLRKFDIIHLHYPFYGAAEIIALSKLLFGKKMKLVIHYHMDSAAKGIKGLVFKIYRLFVLPILLRQAKIITCASLDYVKHSDIAGYYKNYKEKFRQTFFGVDLEQFIPSPCLAAAPAKRADPRLLSQAKFGGGANRNILFVGGLDQAHYFKGLENLLKAVSKLQISDFRFQIVGDGDLRKEYEKLAKKLGIDNIVEFIGSINNSELVKCYREADVLVLPSINQGEAFGLVLLEAMACAKPVVASNLPGVRSVFKNGKHGLLARPDNVDDLVDKLKIILSDKKLAQKMGQAGRKLVESKYTWNKVGERLDLIYHFVNYAPK
ncbi:MAG: glycosyltransferase family 4 protein [Patescibacteria group bacterium]|nr:glycosyltransferase family 4 protein [Patescibacteria group bacterium]